jgi:deoxyribodipyrimidine photo-lyase
MSHRTCGLHWFRRDLRVIGNPALALNHERNGGSVLGIFCFDPTFLARPDFSPDRFGFFLQSLAALRRELRENGGDLLVLEGGPHAAFAELFRIMKDKEIRLPRTISWNRDYEPFARKRDLEMESFFSSQSLEVVTAADHLLAEPEEIFPTGAGAKEFYSVFTPFARRWFEFLHSKSGTDRINQQVSALSPENRLRFKLSWGSLFQENQPPDDQLDRYLAEALRHVHVPLPPAGHAAAVTAVQAFANKLSKYSDDRDFPERNGTSRLSVYLKNGTITIRQIIAILGIGNTEFKDKSGQSTWLRELAWREFYYHILWHRPDVEHQAFLQKYQNLNWQNNIELFEHWKAGTTGFPIVDAAMRELKATGFMHNRCRMIVASFLTKDLLIDWRWGERFFMQKLFDGDLAPNNGGWQWAASTGCDPQPYFRIFNPALQSRKFDPDGRYISRYVPELSSLAGKPEIHEPHAEFARDKYYEPVVSHGTQRLRAMELFKTSQEN